MHDSETIASLFDAWRAAQARLAALPGTTSDEESAAAVEAVHGAEARALALPASTVGDLRRQIVMSLDPSRPGDTSAEAGLARLACLALGLRSTGRRRISSSDRSAGQP